ncbi:calcium-activated chloride channel regulator 1-like isoform X2 [Alligator mississippiensis]|uniref:calcium-activated chloride channel regulator 1-like isoform X2 n=1 Tax=Alligator mississippiensis TaxID=8496 RepID=UPI002877C1E5|nr:calcium-activated chloride channel regulator 1-like isoform X2 [Alligator mississippiensis]
MVFKSMILLVSFQLLLVVRGSMVQLKNGGYEDIVIAIDPHLPEDDKIIENIQAMIKEASAYLFQATEQRFFFKVLKIIIPQTWQQKPDYSRLKTESYDKADVIVADPYLKYGDDPYTLQYGGCGEMGRYIHFTPNFLSNDNLLNIYGSRARVFVHEWAHLRWGVFDEYNNDAPFYVSEDSGEAKVEGTRCSASVAGQYIYHNCHGNRCTTRQCNYDQVTNQFEPGCLFVPEKQQAASASIMYMQSLPSVVKFCNKHSHNEKAPNMQNKMCNYKSTWEVIMNSTDFSNTLPIDSSHPPSEPSFVLLQARDRVVCLVLDVSGSMGAHNRITRLHQAAETFLLQIIEISSWAGIVTFSSSATVQTNLQQIVSENVRQNLIKYLPTRADGGTNICAGVQQGFQVIKTKFSNTDGSEIVLLTDGEDTSMSNCLEEVRRSGSIVHTIALGPQAAPELEQFSKMTGGLQYSATDALESSSLIDAFSGISSGTGNISQQSIQLESQALQVAVSQWMNGSVTVDSTVGNDTFFVVTCSGSLPSIFLKDPKGKQYKNINFTTSTANPKTARLTIADTAEWGDWHYQIQNTNTAPQVITLTVTSRAASLDVPPVTVRAHMNKDTNRFPSPMVIYAEVSQGSSPVLGATVIATVETQAGTAVDLELLDNGSGADVAKNDGIYSRFFTSSQANGRYNLKVRVHGKDKTVRLGTRQSRALYVPGYIENGTIQMNAPRPEVNNEEIQAKLGSFSRTASGGSIVVSGVEGGYADIFPPCKIMDLEAHIEDESIHLSWTAPGGDLDMGQAKQYIIKMSESFLDLRKAFESATSVNTSSLIPRPAGTKESFQFKPENMTVENGTIIYIAIRAIDNASLTSEPSNIAQAALFLPPRQSLPNPFPNNNNPNNGVNNIRMPLIATGSVVVLSMIIGATTHFA